MIRDLRQALRSLRLSPLFAIVAVLVLALGIAANVAIFSVVSGVWLHLLPYDDPARVMMIWEDQSKRGGTARSQVAPATFLDWESEASEVFSEMAALRNESRRLTALDDPVVPLVHTVTEDYFQLLGSRPWKGRLFERGDAGSSIALVSHALWQGPLGGDPEIVGTTIELDGEPHTVVGVVPVDFWSQHVSPTQPDIWLATDLSSRQLDRDRRDLVVFGRLAPGVSLGAARARMRSIAEGIARRHPDSNADWNATVLPVRDDIVGRVKPTLSLLLVAAAAVLLLASANVANLLLARSSRRQRELSVRAALGAGWSRLIRVALSEGLVLAAGGGLAGLLLAALAVPRLVAMIPRGAGVPFLESVQIEPRVVGYAALATLFAAALFATLPTLRAARTQPGAVLRVGGDRASSGRRGEILIVAEVALALVLVTAAGLLLQSFGQLRDFDPGFSTANTLTIRNSLRGPAVREPALAVEYFDEAIRELERLPEIETAGAVSFPPPYQGGFLNRFSSAAVGAELGDTLVGLTASINGHYFEALGVPVLAGRGFDERDTASSAAVAVISQSFAQRHFADRDPVGLTLTPAPDTRPILGPGVERTIVGVVGDVAGAGSDPTPHPMVYFPHAQTPFPIMSLVMKSTVDPLTAGQQAEALLWRLTTDGNLYARETMAQRIADTRWQVDLAALLLAAFAVLALALGAAGIFAVISYSVAGRGREIGLRMALGAQAGSVRRMVLGRAFGLASLGIVLGTVLAWLLADLLEGLLFGVSPTDLQTLSSVAAALLGIAIAAAWLPAERAARTDPARVLRGED